MTSRTSPTISGSSAEVGSSNSMISGLMASVMDIQKAGDFIKSATFNAFMPLFGTAVIYYA